MYFKMQKSIFTALKNQKWLQVLPVGFIKTISLLQKYQNPQLHL